MRNLKAKESDRELEMNVVIKSFYASSFFDSLNHSVILTFPETSLCTSDTHTYIHTHLLPTYGTSRSVSPTHTTPRELIKIRETGLEHSCFCLNKQRLLLIGFTLREVFKAVG